MILYGRRFHSFLMNNFLKLLRNNNNYNSKNNNNFAFQIYALGKNFVKIMNLYLAFFSHKIAWSYNAKTPYLQKNPLGTIPKMNEDNVLIQHPRYHVSSYGCISIEIWVVSNNGIMVMV